MSANNSVGTGAYNIGLECRHPLPLPVVDDNLVCGDLLVDRSIEQRGEVDLITFSGTAGSTVDLTLVRVGFGGGPPRATVFAPSGTEVVAFSAERQQEIMLPESGTYVVRVNSNSLVGTGAYNIGLECRQPLPLPVVDDTLTCGDLLVNRSIEQPGEVDLITFSGTAGSTVDLTFIDTGFALTPRARATVFAPSGTEVVVMSGDIQQEINLPESGTYVIRVNASNLRGVGTYNLGLECRQPLSGVVGNVACGDLFSGQVTAEGQVDLISFTGQVGQVIDLTLVEAPRWGGVDSVNDARGTLFAPSGVQVAQFDSDVQQTFTLSENGSYIVRINANDLEHTGSYNLGMECRQNPVAVVDDTMSCGSLVSGAMEVPGEVDLITFTGQVGQVIDLTLVEVTSWGGVSSANDARGTLFAPSGVQVAQFDSNAQQTFTLSEAGSYIVRINANRLDDTGPYNLGMECRQNPVAVVDDTMSCGIVVRGAIADPGEVDLITFTGEVDQVIDLTLEEVTSWGGVSSANDARGTLFAPSGVQVAQFDSNTQEMFTLLESGTYIVRVNANNVVSTGRVPVTGMYDLGLGCSE